MSTGCAEWCSDRSLIPVPGDECLGTYALYCFACDACLLPPPPPTAPPPPPDTADRISLVTLVLVTVFGAITLVDLWVVLCWRRS